MSFSLLGVGFGFDGIFSHVDLIVRSSLELVSSIFHVYKNIYDI